MQFSFQKSFGYPVLRLGSDDYTSGAFQPTIIPRNVAKGEEEARIDCRFAISVEEISSLIDVGKASFAIVIDCRDTFYREIFETNDKRATFFCSSDMLKGRVVFESYIIVKEKISDYLCKHIDEFYGPGPHQFTPGMVLAQGLPVEKNIHAEKLRDNQSLMSFHSDENLKMGEWWFDILNEFPSVYVSPEQLASINSAPTASNPIIENTFLVPIVSEMVAALRDEELVEEVCSYPWSGLILEGLKKPDEGPKNPDDDESLISDLSKSNIRLAQIFLGLPLARQNQLMVGLGE